MSTSTPDSGNVAPFVIVEVNVAGVEDGAALGPENHARGAEDVTGVDKLSGDPSHILAGPRAFTGQRERLSHGTGPPFIRRPVGFLVSEERINRDADLLALPRHDTDRVVQECAPDFRGRFRHEDAGIGPAPH